MWMVLSGMFGCLVCRGGLCGSHPTRPAPLALMPAVLLMCASLEPSELGERLIVGLVTPAIAALTLWLAPGMRGLAICAAGSVGFYAIDVVSGSHLTELALIGPNPIAGVRFYGIGNELEATVAALV